MILRRLIYIITRLMKRNRIIKEGIRVGESVITDNSLIVRVGGRTFCGKKFLVVENVSSPLSVVGGNEALHILKTYYNALNVGFPVEVKTFLSPIDRELFLKNIDKKLENLLLILEFNPSSTSLKTKIDKLSRARANVLKEGLTPYEALTYFAVVACSNDINELVNNLSIRVKVLRDSLSSVGIKVRELRIKGSKSVLRIFFRRNTLNRLFRREAVRVITDYTLFLAIPSLVGNFSYVTSRGLFLGNDIINNKLVYWDLERSSSPHIVVVGPTGSGKTEFLSVISCRYHKEYNGGVIVFDIKREYGERFRRVKCHFNEFVLGENVGLGISEVIALLPNSLRLHLLMDVVASIISIAGLRDGDKLLSLTYKVLSNELRSNGFSDFYNLIEDVISYIEGFEDPYLSYELSKAVNILKALEGRMSIIRLLMNNSINIIDMSKVLTLGRAYVAITSEVLSLIIRAYLTLIGKALRRPRITRMIVYDEGWLFLKYLGIDELLRLSRSYGVSVALASQRVDDFNINATTALLNSGLFAAMPSPMPEYWHSIAKLMIINMDDIIKLASILGRGEAVVRIAPNPRPYIIRFIDFS